jgi:O-antigen/teichoic acid export membrane protein
MTESPILPSAATPGRRTGRRLLVNSAYVLLAELGAKFASLALVVVMARILGPDSYGIYALTLSASAVIFTAAHFGQDQVLVRDVAVKPALLSKYFADVLGIKLTLGIVALSVGLPAFMLMRQDDVARTVMFLIGLAGLADILTTTCLAAFQALDRMAYIPLVRISQRVLVASIASTLLLWGHSLQAVAGVYLMASVAALTLGVLLLRRMTRVTLRIDIHAWKPLILAAVPIGVAGVLASILFRVDTLILGFFQSNTVVGVYNAAYRFVDVTLFLSFSIGTVVYPTLARVRKTNPLQLPRLLGGIMKLLMALSLPIAALAGVLAESLVEVIYGPSFRPAARALVLLAPTIALFPIAHVLGLLLISYRRERSLLRIYVVMTVANIGFNLLVIPRFSFYGAALVTSLTEFLLVLALGWEARTLLRGLPLGRAVSGPALSAVGAAIIAFALQADLFVTALISGAVFLLLLVLYEALLFPDDLRELRLALVKERAQKPRMRDPDA